LKYWTYFVAKLAALALVMLGAWALLDVLLPPPDLFLRHQVARFPQDLRWTSAILFLWLMAVGLVYVIVWDQRRRCRTCLRRLMMPVNRGSWGRATLMSPPETEMICPYGHGTLAEADTHLPTAHGSQWTEHSDDIWKELEELEGRER
jgi:hypothetical protein